jgi:ribonuclease HI
MTKIKTNSTKVEKTIKRYANKRKRKGMRKKTLIEDNKKKEPKINLSAHELLAFTLSYLMLTPW